jgi:hypothetical protein
MTLGCLQSIILEFWFKRFTRGKWFWRGRRGHIWCFICAGVPKLHVINWMMIKDQLLKISPIICFFNHIYLWLFYFNYSKRLNLYFQLLMHVFGHINCCKVVALGLKTQDFFFFIEYEDELYMPSSQCGCLSCCCK